MLVLSLDVQLTSGATEVEDFGAEVGFKVSARRELLPEEPGVRPDVVGPPAAVGTEPVVDNGGAGFALTGVAGGIWHLHG